MNSREKGKRGERQWRDELRANGYAARRGQQFSGSPDSPDVICDGLPWAHFEVKLVERLDLYAAMDQARRDSAGKAPLVAHRRNFWPWLVTMDAERFYRLLKQDLTGQWAERMAGGSPDAVFAGLPWAFGQVHEGRRLNIHEAMAEARRDSQRTEDRGQRSEIRGQMSEDRGQRSGKGVPVVVHRRSFRPWLVTMEAESFFEFLRGTLPPERTGAARREQRNQRLIRAL
jgi:hypothetical protein